MTGVDVGRDEGALPILYSFRRCPYAMRARMALDVAGYRCELREVVLKNKPSHMLQASAKGTVPVLVHPDGQIVDESLDIMLLALRSRDPEGWLTTVDDKLDKSLELIHRCDDDFKTDLDRYKYASRFDGEDPTLARQRGAVFLSELDDRIGDGRNLFGDATSLADIAILPFVRQFRIADEKWFDDQPWSALHVWLDAFLASPRFARVMTKYPAWASGDEPTIFPSADG